MYGDWAGTAAGGKDGRRHVRLGRTRRARAADRRLDRARLSPSWTRRRSVGPIGVSRSGQRWRNRRRGRWTSWVAAGAVYSWRSETIGSTREALRAGPQPPPRRALPKNAAATAR